MSLIATIRKLLQSSTFTAPQAKQVGDAFSLLTDAAITSAPVLLSEASAEFAAGKVLTAGTNITLTPGAGTLTIAASGGSGGSSDGLITVSFDGQEGVVAAGSWHQVRLSYDGTITGAYLTGDGQTGSTVVDVRIDTRASIPPTGVDSICASAKPTISSAKSSDDTTLTGWDTALAAGDALLVYVESCSVFKKLELQLTTVKT